MVDTPAMTIVNSINKLLEISPCFVLSHSSIVYLRKKKVLFNEDNMKCSIRNQLRKNFGTNGPESSTIQSPNKLFTVLWRLWCELTWCLRYYMIIRKFFCRKKRSTAKVTCKGSRNHTRFFKFHLRKIQDS